METILHELGHAVYELGYDSNLPWLLREPPHMITTEAMALIAGRQAYRYSALCNLLPKSAQEEFLMKKADASLKRRQLIFSRWVMVMTEFESELYRNPNQALNDLWWSIVEKYQMIGRPKGRIDKCDWAAKYHIGLAPVYYFSYLLGEMFASAMEMEVKDLACAKAGNYFQQKLFNPGNKMSWDKLVHHVTGAPLTADAWIKQFAYTI
jgi:peptidyl-dipeptidase A